MLKRIDASGLAVFRILFGAVMCAGVVRFMLSGWVHELYVRPEFFFKYPGFEWVVVPPPWALYALFGGVALAALFVALGLFYRVSVVVFGLGFTYAQLMDATNYLNHYYLVVLLSVLMAFLPLHAEWSLDARRRPALRRPTLPAWMLWLLRFQVALVYLHAAVAKLHPDWLVHAQPLQIWLSSRADLPLVGGLLSQSWMPWAMAWGGFLYDLLIVPALLWRRTRALAYLAVLVFHALTHALFDIGMFPFIMVAATTVFFAPDWARRRLNRPTVETDGRAASPPALARPALAAWIAFQLLFPARHLVYEGDVLWNERGMRYAWKVMVREKQGSVTYVATHRETGRAWEVNPADFLEYRQLSEMSGQPDLIVQLAHHVRSDFRRRGLGDVAVSAEAWVSLNGRAPRLLLDPSIDLTARGDAAPDWILTEPEEPPLNRARAGVR